MTLREFCKRYQRGDFNHSDFDIMVEAGWCDWFCDDEELLPRLKKIWKILDGITSDYVLDSFSVYFYNHWPIKEPVYDSIVFIPLNENKHNESLFGVRLKNQSYEIYSEKNCYDNEIVCRTIEETCHFINQWEQEILQYQWFSELYEKNKDQIFNIIASENPEALKNTKMVSQLMENLSEDARNQIDSLLNPKSDW